MWEPASRDDWAPELTAVRHHRRRSSQIGQRDAKRVHWLGEGNRPDAIAARRSLACNFGLAERLAERTKIAPKLGTGVRNNSAGRSRL